MFSQVQNFLKLCAFKFFNTDYITIFRWHCCFTLPHTRTHTQTRTDTQTHAQTDAYPYTNTRTHRGIQIHVRMHTGTHNEKRAHILTTHSPDTNTQLQPDTQ